MIAQRGVTSGMAVLGGEIHSLSRVVALVTGAASGLGRATAARLAKQVGTQVHFVVSLVYF